MAYKNFFDTSVRRRDFSAIFAASFGTQSIRALHVVVIGCNSGQEVPFYRNFFARIDLVDPLIPQLKMHESCNATGVHLHPVAISSEVGVKHFFAASNGGESSSLLSPSHHRVEYPGIKFSETEVLCCRLIDLEFFFDATVLVLDVQGSEIDVLESASATGLAHLKLIICEYSLVPLYEGSANLSSIISFLDTRGFRLAFTTSPYISPSVCTGDAVFVRNDLFN